MARPKGVVEKKPRKRGKIKSVSPGIEWVLDNVENKDAKHANPKVMGLLRLVRNDEVIKKRLYMKWVEAQLDPAVEEVSAKKDEPLMEMIDSLIADWKAKKK